MHEVEHKNLLSPTMPLDPFFAQWPMAMGSHEKFSRWPITLVMHMALSSQWLESVELDGEMVCLVLLSLICMYEEKFVQTCQTKVKLV